MQALQNQTIIPTQLVGPIKIIGDEVNAAVKVPLATYETPLWPSVNRGARVSRIVGGINVVVINNCMTRSVLLEANSVNYINNVVAELSQQRNKLEELTKSTSRFAELKDWRAQIVGNLLYLRFSFFTGNAAGHNMATKAAETIMNWIIEQYPELRYVSISGNSCTDKKVSAINSILGRGKYVIAEIKMPKEICVSQLRTTAEKIVDLNIKKNLIGSIVSGGVCSANAHFANMLLAFYLATGQDAANIVEGSQGITYAELRGDDLYFSVTVPNIIVGTAGNAKNISFVRENLQLMGCLEDDDNSGKNAQRLAVIAAATVLCGELSLLAAQTNRGELMHHHIKLERFKK